MISSFFSGNLTWTLAFERSLEAFLLRCLKAQRCPYFPGSSSKVYPSQRNCHSYSKASPLPLTEISSREFQCFIRTTVKMSAWPPNRREGAPELRVTALQTPQYLPQGSAPRTWAQCLRVEPELRDLGWSPGLDEAPRGRGNRE